MGDFSNDPDSVLSGLWGSLVAAASNGRSAANMWNALKVGAYNYAEGILNVTSATTPTDEEIQQAASGLISHVTIQDMNRYVSLAGQYLSAKANLHALGPGDQIPGNAIFSAPWAATAGNPAVPTRYRIRVLRDITVYGFTAINRQEWGTYEVTSPLTTAADALLQANQLFSQAKYNSRASINDVLDYSIEVV